MPHSYGACFAAFGRYGATRRDAAIDNAAKRTPSASSKKIGR